MAGIMESITGMIKPQEPKNRGMVQNEITLPGDQGITMSDVMRLVKDSAGRGFADYIGINKGSPFQLEVDPRTVQGSNRYRGIGNLFERANMVENPNSVPVKAMKFLISQLPNRNIDLIMDDEDALQQDKRLGTTYFPPKGTSTYANVGITPYMSRGQGIGSTDPMSVMVHELGHVLHGNTLKNVPGGEGMAVGMTNEIYGDRLKPPSEYDTIYKDKPAYREGKQLGQQIGVALKNENKESLLNNLNYMSNTIGLRDDLGIDKFENKKYGTSKHGGS